jgi:hypothetical protein
MLLLLLRPLVCFFFFYTLHVHYMVRDSNGGCGPIIWGLHTHTHTHTARGAALTVPAQLNSPAGQIRQITCAAVCAKRGHGVAP